jgi:hypothetical protein
MNTVGFPSWRIMANRRHLRFDHYYTELGADFINAKFYSRHESRNWRSSSMRRVTFSV